MIIAQAWFIIILIVSNCIPVLQTILFVIGMKTGGGAFEWHTIPALGEKTEDGDIFVRIPKMQMGKKKVSSKSFPFSEEHLVLEGGVVCMKEFFGHAIQSKKMMSKS